MAAFGVDYYPEHWPASRWPVDARMMREAGIGMVRMAEFAWAKMEPAEGKFDFGWLDEAIGVLAGEGIRVVLGTPTATPPAWIIEAHPEILPVDQTGMVRGFGGRHHDCQSNEAYRGHIRRFVRAMARHFRQNPHVIGWQIDNELGNSHRGLCCCDSCKQAFHAWLQRRYGTIAALNEAWGTVFWSQTYSTFSQIPVPLPTPNSHNPSLLLDWKRFCSDLIVDFQKLQIDILREECPGQFITHNYMGFFDKTNYFDLARDLDFVCHNQYPLHFRKDRDPVAPPHRLAAVLDLMRGIKRKPFWIMEGQAGPSGWETLSATPRPGQIRLWTYQAVAHGADAMVYFRWRTCLVGTEQFWHGILPHSGEPGRRYAEVQQTIRELTPLMSRLGDGQGAEVAIAVSYDQEWALQIQPHHPDFDYIAHLMTYYAPLYQAHVPVDLISDADDFSAYKLVIAPLMFLMTPDLEAKLRRYVARGGLLVLTLRTGVKDANNRAVPHTLPGRLADVVGVTVEDYDCLWGVGQAVRWQDGEGAAAPEPCRKWCDILTLRGARPLALYTMDYYRDTPAITANAYEQGRAYYVGTELPPTVMQRFVARLLADAGVAQLLPAPEGVEVARRRGKDGDYLFLLNHTATALDVPLPAPQRVLIGRDAARGDALHLAPYEVAVCTSA